MRKIEEIANPNSCLRKAKENEMLFVLLARDKAAPRVIRYWAAERVRLGLNKIDDKQIVEAFECATIMEKENS